MPPHTVPLRLLYVLAFVALLAAGCDASDPIVREPDERSVYVANQGNFTDGNGSVTFYDTGLEEAETPVDGLRSIVQSILLDDKALYVMANTGQRVDLFDAGTGAATGQVAGVANPRYAALAGPSKLYVTSQLYDAPSQVTILDLDREVIADSVILGGSGVEGITVAAGRAFVATGAFGADSTVAVIDTQTDVLVQTIELGCAARFVLADGDGEVYAFCRGGEVVLLDAASGNEVGRLDVGGEIRTAEGVGQDAFYAPATREIYAVRGADTILRFDTRGDTLAATLGPIAGAPIGAVAYDADDERLYVSHVPGFAEAGVVTVHDRTGAEVGRFTAGVAPGHIDL